MKFENVNVEIIETRWHIQIHITNKDGEKEVYFASADSYYTGGSGIWFGTEEEYENE